MYYRPRNRIVEIADPSGSVVELSAMKAHARVDFADDDADVAAAEKAAVRAVEHATQRLLIAREVVLRLPDLPPQRIPIELPGGPVSTLTSVIADGDPVTGATVYGSAPAILVPGADWPEVTGEGYPVVITYTAGYATVPDDLLLAVKMLGAHFYANREAVLVNLSAAPLPLGVEAMVGPYRVRPI